MHKGEVPFSEKIHLLVKRYFFDYIFVFLHYLFSIVKIRQRINNPDSVRG